MYNQHRFGYLLEIRKTLFQHCCYRIYTGYIQSLTELCETSTDT